MRQNSPDIDTYEKSINKNIRKRNGIYYTPPNIVKFIVDTCFQYCRPRYLPTVIDPACGAGSFLTYVIPKMLIRYPQKSTSQVMSNVYGIDSDKTAIELCKQRIAAQFNTNTPPNLIHHNTIDPAFISHLFGKFDIVVSNPPYVRIQNLPEPTRRLIKSWPLSNYGDSDIYLTFFEVALKLLKPRGVIGFITPNSYFYSAAAKRLREVIFKNTMLRVVVDFDERQVFDDKATTYAAISILKKDSKHPSYFFFGKNFKSLQKIPFTTLRKERFLFSNASLINKRTGPLLSDVTDIKVGIATLRDKIYLVDNNVKDHFITKHWNGKEFRIEQTVTRRIIKVSKLKQENDINSHMERIIFPYEKDDSGKLELLDEDQFQTNFPNAYAFLSHVKNELVLRDRGKRDYGPWFAYGRPQGLNLSGEKILVPPITKEPNFILCRDRKLLFYAGYAIFMKKPYKDKILTLYQYLKSPQAIYDVKLLSRKFRGGWIGLSKLLLQMLPLPSDFIKRNRDEA